MSRRGSGREGRRVASSATLPCWTSGPFQVVCWELVFFHGNLQVQPRFRGHVPKVVIVLVVLSIVEVDDRMLFLIIVLLVLVVLIVLVVLLVLIVVRRLLILFRLLFVCRTDPCPHGWGRSDRRRLCRGRGLRDRSRFGRRRGWCRRRWRWQWWERSRCVWGPEDRRNLQREIFRPERCSTLLQLRLKYVYQFRRSGGPERKRGCFDVVAKSNKTEQVLGAVDGEHLFLQGLVVHVQLSVKGVISFFLNRHKDAENGVTQLLLLLGPHVILQVVD
mmetsp:Transcript_26253/g.56962  ORF Transcript_26253/g.56962 Transcript_26253/m.56962 type:complete len:275 (-) Transcript_26253:298-1122(-)